MSLMSQIKSRVPERLTSEYNNFLTAPAWRRYLWLAVAVALAGYLLWCRFGTQPIKPGTTVDAPTSPQIAQMARAEIHPQKVVVFADKAAAVKKLGLPPEQAMDPKEALFQSTSTPATRHGSTTTTFLNTSTGRPRSVTTILPAPWFALERTNYAGVGIGMSSSDGVVYQAFLKRDLAQVKGVYLQGEAQVIARPSSIDRKLEGIGWANAVYPF